MALNWDPQMPSHMHMGFVLFVSGPGWLCKKEAMNTHQIRIYDHVRRENVF